MSHLFASCFCMKDILIHGHLQILNIFKVCSPIGHYESRLEYFIAIPPIWSFFCLFVVCFCFFSYLSYLCSL